MTWSDFLGTVIFVNKIRGPGTRTNAISRKCEGRSHHRLKSITVIDLDDSLNNCKLCSISSCKTKGCGYYSQNATSQEPSPF